MTSFPLKLGTIVHYRPKGADEGHLEAGIITRLPNGEREAWVKEGDTVDLSLFRDEGSRSVRSVALDEHLSSGTFCPADTSVSRHVERT